MRGLPLNGGRGFLVFRKMSEFRISGRPTSGLGWASKTVPRQLPLLLQHLPELESCYPATINLRLEKNLRIEQPDVVTPGIDWSEGWIERLPPETFRLTRIEFEIVGKHPRQTGWIYEASFSPHRGNAWFVEFLAPFTQYTATDVFILYFQKEARREDLVYLS